MKTKTIVGLLMALLAIGMVSATSVDYTSTGSGTTTIQTQAGTLSDQLSVASNNFVVQQQVDMEYNTGTHAYQTNLGRSAQIGNGVISAVSDVANSGYNGQYGQVSAQIVAQDSGFLGESGSFNIYGHDGSAGMLDVNSNGYGGITESASRFASNGTLLGTTYADISGNSSTDMNSDWMVGQTTAMGLTGFWNLQAGAAGAGTFNAGGIEVSPIYIQNGQHYPYLYMNTTSLTDGVFSTFAVNTNPGKSSFLGYGSASQTNNFDSGFGLEGAIVVQ